MFLDILERKNTFLGYKNKKFKQWKNCHFCKGVSYGFGLKLAAFPFFLGNKGQDNVIYDILEQKKRDFRLYKQEVQKVEKLPFFRG